MFTWLLQCVYLSICVSVRHQITHKNNHAAGWSPHATFIIT